MLFDICVYFYVKNTLVFVVYTFSLRIRYEEKNHSNLLKDVLSECKYACIPKLYLASTFEDVYQFEC